MLFYYKQIQRLLISKMFQKPTISISRWYVDLPTHVHRNSPSPLQNLGLGVFEDRKIKGAAHADFGSELSSGSSTCSSNSDDEESDSSADIISSTALRPIKPLPKRAQPRPAIVELDCDHR